MGFAVFVEQYLEDMKPRLKYNTFLIKEYIITNKILSYFENRSLVEISATDIIQWQNELLKMISRIHRPISEQFKISLMQFSTMPAGFMA